MNKYFINLLEIGICKDPELTQNFFKEMIVTSIEKALYTSKGVLRPDYGLDYRYIESFIKLVVVLLKT
jgi:hypothetical protein